LLLTIPECLPFDNGAGHAGFAREDTPATGVQGHVMGKPILTARGERRAHVRYPHALRTSCRPLGLEARATWTARIEDVSQAGVVLETDREVRTGAVLVVALEGMGGRFSRPLLARVMNVRPRPAGGWHLGCTFVRSLSENEVQALLLANPAE
jgi:hypothetical protein